MSKYVEAELEIIAFDAEDVITTSPTVCNPDECSGHGGWT
jgi:hypothetical protein